MIATNIILKKKNTILSIKTEEQTNCIKTNCIITTTLNETTIKCSFLSNKDISVTRYREQLDREVLPMIRDFETLIQLT